MIEQYRTITIVVGAFVVLVLIVAALDSWVGALYDRAEEEDGDMEW